MNVNGFSGTGETGYSNDYRPEFAPLRGRWTYRVVDPGEILEVDAIVVRSDEWAERREASDSTWQSIDFGEFVVAVKALG